MSAELWVAVLVLALVDTLSPTTLAVTIGVLLAGGPLVRRMMIYLTTLAACYFAFGASLMLGLGLTLDADRLMDPGLDPWFFATGVVLVALSFLIDPGTKAAKQERRRRAAERAAARRAGQSERMGRGGALAMVGLGMTTLP